MRKGLLALLVAALLIALSASVVQAGEYVALGHSSAAGPPPPAQLPPLGSLKSSSNSAPRANLPLQNPSRDAPCSGAKTTHMTTARGVPRGPTPPQFDSLSPTTTLVSVTIGG